MVDIHSHILPKIDDGAKFGYETFEMIKLSIKDGVTDIVATPHYCVGYGEESFKEVKRSVKELRKLLKEENLNIKVHYGQEVYYSTRILEDLTEENIGTINDGKYMLIEFHMRALENEDEIFNNLYELRLKGITPIIAHPERYKYVQRNRSILNRFIEEGCLFQLNVGSILGRHGEETKKCAEILLKNKIYSFIGSDTHDLNLRKPGLKKGLEVIKEIDEDIAVKFRKNGMKLLKDEKIDFEGDLIKKGRRKKKMKVGGFSFLL
ncbi:MAG: tyrosine-protein phosphatase [Clostridium sp.]